MPIPTLPDESIRIRSVGAYCPVLEVESTKSAPPPVPSAVSAAIVAAWTVPQFVLLVVNAIGETSPAVAVPVF